MHILYFLGPLRCFNFLLGLQVFTVTAQQARAIYLFFSYWAAFKLLGGHPDAGTATQTCSQWSDTCGAGKLVNRYEGRVLTSSAAVKSPLPSSSSSVDQTNRAFVTFQARTDTCQCVRARRVYPKRYSPGAVSGQSRFAGLFRLAAGGRAVLRRTVNSFEWFKAFSVCP